MGEYTIDISEATESEDDMVDLLREIADLIEDGYTSGMCPSWVLKEVKAEEWF